MEGEADKLYPVLEPIAKRIKKYEQFAAFNSVCTSWRAASRREIFQGLRLVQGTPHLMLSAKEEDDDREFYSLKEEHLAAKVSLPDVKGKRCMESMGWFLTISPQGDMSLMNPFTDHDKIRLPRHENFPYFARLNSEPGSFIQKMALSSRPCQTSNFVVTIIFDTFGRLCFWRPGDENWTEINILPPVGKKCWRIRSQILIRSFHDITYCNGQSFTIDSFGIVWTCHLAPNLSEANFLVDIPCYGYGIQFYRVECLGKLLVIACHRGGVNWEDWSQRGLLELFNLDLVLWDAMPPFEIFEVDISTRTCARINNLGGKALFIGHNTSLLVNASDALKIKANHIYYAGSLCLPNAAAWIYSLEDGNMELLDKGSLVGRTCPPVWISPCF